MSPAPHITNHALRTQRADTWVRPYNEMTGATSHEPQLQATSYKPPAAFFDSPDEAGHAGRAPGPMPDEKPWFCCCRRAKRWNVVEGLKPALPVKSRKLSMAFLQATGYEPQAIPPPSLRTTYHAPRTTYQQGGRTGPPRGRDDTHCRQRAATTSHKLQATCRCFVIPTKGALGSHEPVQASAVSVARSLKKQW